MVRTSALGSLPKETVGLVVMEVRSLRSLGSFARWMQEMASAAEQEGPLRDLKGKFGSDTLDRIDRLALAVMPQPGNTAGYALIAEGRIDEQKVRAALEGKEYETVEPAAEGRPEVSLTVLRGGALALGPRLVLEAVRANAERRGGGLVANATMLDLLGSVRPTSHLWGAVDFRTMARLGRQAAGGQVAGAQAIGAQAIGATLPDNPLVSALVAFAFQGRLGSTVELDVVGRADGEANAKGLADTARSLIRIGQVGATPEKAGDWLAFLNGITIQQKGAEITMHATLPEAIVSSLAEKARAAAAEMPAGPPPAGAKPPAAGKPPAGAKPPAAPKPAVEAKPPAGF